MAGDKPGEKVDDYWEPGKALLQDPTKFLESLFKYDKVSKLYCVEMNSLMLFNTDRHLYMMYVHLILCTVVLTEQI